MHGNILARPAGSEPTTHWFVGLELINQAIVFKIFPARPLLDVCSSVPNSVQKVAHKSRKRYLLFRLKSSEARFAASSACTREGCSVPSFGDCPCGAAGGTE